MIKELNLEGVTELLAIATQNAVPLDVGKSITPSKAVNPIIVIEGLDATGMFDYDCVLVCIGERLIGVWT